MTKPIYRIVLCVILLLLIKTNCHAEKFINIKAYTLTDFSFVQMIELLNNNEYYKIEEKYSRLNKSQYSYSINENGLINCNEMVCRMDNLLLISSTENIIAFLHSKDIDKYDYLNVFVSFNVLEGYFLYLRKGNDIMIVPLFFEEDEKYGLKNQSIYTIAQFAEIWKAHDAELFVFDKSIQCGIKPYMAYKKVFMPLRIALEAAEIDVRWYADTNTILINNIEITVLKGDYEHYGVLNYGRDNEEYYSIQIVNDRIIVDSSFMERICKSIGLIICCDYDNRTITIGKDI